MVVLTMQASFYVTSPLRLTGMTWVLHLALATHVSFRVTPNPTCSEAIKVLHPPYTYGCTSRHPGGDFGFAPTLHE